MAQASAVCAPELEINHSETRVSGNGDGMSNYRDWVGEDTPPKKKLPALDVGPIHGVLPFEGARNPLTRSNTAKRISAAIATPRTGGVRQVYHFDGEAEFYVAVEALLSPDLYGLEVQLAPIDYYDRRSRKWRQHYFDLRLTYADGHRRAVFVRNGTSLAKQETQDEIDDIFAALTLDFADTACVVDADRYTKAYKDNLRRLWECSKVQDAEADGIVEKAAREESYWLLRDLISKCPIENWRAFQAAMRLVARKVLRADLYGVLDYTSRVALHS